VNVVVPAGRLDPSGVPDYNAVVEITPLGRQEVVATSEVTQVKA
jgi:hypothetical protein